MPADNGDGILHSILNEGLRGVVGAPQNAGGSARGLGLDTSPNDVTGPIPGLYDHPVHHGRDAHGWDDQRTQPTYSTVRYRNGQRTLTPKQLAIPDPLSHTSRPRKRSLGHASLSAAELDEQRRRTNLAAQSESAWSAHDQAQSKPLTGPQFDQPSLPGLGGGNEQMTLFRTQTLGAPGAPTTTRGAYHTSPDAADWTDRTNTQVPLSAIPAPENSLEYGGRTPGEDDAWKGEEPGPTIKVGSRDHVNALAQEDNEDLRFTGGNPDERANPATRLLFNGTQFGDNVIRDNPVQYDELSSDDDGYNFAQFTPDGTQVTGYDYEESYEGDRATITGAGTGSQFRGQKFGMRGAMDFARQKNDEGVFVHGNTFTDDGQRAFGNNGAMTEGEVDSVLREAKWEGAAQHRESVQYDAESEWESWGKQDYLDDEDAVRTRSMDDEKSAFIENYAEDNLDEEYAKDTAREDAVSGLVQSQRSLLAAAGEMFGDVRQGVAAAGRAAKGKMTTQLPLRDKDGMPVGGDDLDRRVAQSQQRQRLQLTTRNASFRGGD